MRVAADRMRCEPCARIGNIAQRRRAIFSAELVNLPLFRFVCENGRAV